MRVSLVNDALEIFYNRQRMHSSYNYLSPTEYEEKMLRMGIGA